ncbi:hypothetical protein ABJI51_05115 [Amycolatopsis sp. NEAU-NG30]|uniref:Uncharacterized protein n=1 Tax=Amycolatopsis melonis TaxID=3156488 RepID=A0ABV0L801_9PSEU
MTMIERVANQQVPAHGGVLAPLDDVSSRLPVGCYSVAEARVAYALARQAGLSGRVVAHWADQVAAAVRAGRWGSFARDEAPSAMGAASAADMSVGDLLATIL